MPKIFISYRRADSRLVTNRIYDKLVGVFGKQRVFKDIDSLKVGQDFRGALREATAQCDIMLVVIGPNWLTVTDDAGNRRLDNPEDFVRLEVETGLQRDGILVIPVLVEGAKPIPVDSLPASLKELAYNHAFTIHDDPLFHQNMDTLIRQLKQRRMNWGAIGLLAFIALLVTVIGLSGSFNNRGNPSDTPTLQATTAVAQVESPTDSASVTPADTPTVAPTLPIAQIVETLDAQATLDQATLNAEATFSARATEYAVGTQSVVDATATATLWTHTPTPNITASIEAFQTQRAQTATQAWINSWTSTPTPTFTRTHTPTPTFTLTSTPTPNATQTLEVFARTPMADNALWTPAEREFEGVMMVLVPAGCFMMGSTQYDDEKPVHEVCITQPFWLDKTEVTQAQFVANGGVKANSNAFSGDDRPVERITWGEAVDYCEQRGGHLPTEAEWEFAARGPDGLIYPWGDEFVGANLVYNRTFSQGTTDVGSIAAGASWVGALDMSSNVWEWTSSLYLGYPYDDADGREDLSASGARVVRGGSWGNVDYDRRAANRVNVTSVNSYVGFRCARSQ